MDAPHSMSLGTQSGRDRLRGITVDHEREHCAVKMLPARVVELLDACDELEAKNVVLRSLVRRCTSREDANRMHGKGWLSDEEYALLASVLADPSEAEMPMGNGNGDPVAPPWDDPDPSVSEETRLREALAESNAAGAAAAQSLEDTEQIEDALREALTGLVDEVEAVATGHDPERGIERLRDAAERASDVLAASGPASDPSDSEGGA